MFKLQSPSKYVPFGARHLLRLFHCSKRVNFDAFQCFCRFLFHLLPPHRQNVSPWGLFSSRETKNVAPSETRWIGRMGHRVLVKNCWVLSTVWASALVNCPSWDGETCWKSLQKNSLKPNTASHNNASWYTDTDGFLEYSLSKGSLYYKGPTLQMIILGFWASWVGTWELYHYEGLCISQNFFFYTEDNRTIEEFPQEE